MHARRYVKQYREREASLVSMKRAARKKGTFYVEDEPKLLFVMRLRGINGMHPKTRHIMKVGVELFYSTEGGSL